MSVFENRIKQLQRIAPSMKFEDACKLAEEFEQHSLDVSRQNYVVLLLLEMIGVDSNGHFPEELKRKAIEKREYAFAIHEAGHCHGGHSCGIPGYSASMSHYYSLFLHNKFDLWDQLRQFQQTLKESLKENNETTHS